MGDKRIIDRYRKKIRDLEDDKKRLQLESSALKRELSAANSKYETLSEQMNLSITGAEQMREEMRSAIEEANQTKEAYTALIQEAMDMKNAYQRTMKKLIGKIERVSSAIDK